MSKRKKRIIHQQNLAFMIIVLLGTIITARGEKKTFDFPATTLTTMVLTTKKTIRDSELRCAGKNPQQPKSQAE